MNSKALFNATCWFILGDVSMIIAINMPSYVSLGTAFKVTWDGLTFINGSFESRRAWVSLPYR